MNKKEMNLIIICADTFRADYLGCYGNKWIRTPHLDNFAKESVLFENAFVEGLPTGPERIVFFTGKYTLPFRGWVPLSRDEITLAEILQQEGYINGLVTDNFHFFEPGINYHRGFHSFKWIRGQESDKYVSAPLGDNPENYLKTGWKKIPPEKKQTPDSKEHISQYLRNVHSRGKEENFFAAQVIRESERWLKENAHHKNFFLWIDCFDPHEPWDPPQKYYEMYKIPKYTGPKLISPWDISLYAEDFTKEERSHIKALYAGEITFVDHWIGYLLEKIKDLNLKDNTIIVFLSDHGTFLGEHNNVCKTPKKGHNTLYRELVKIPLMIYVPAGPQNMRIKDFVWTPDILPTILYLLKIKSPFTVNGRNFWPLIEGKTDAGRSFVISGWFDLKTYYVSTKEWSYIHTPNEKHRELYHILQDPKETSNVIDKYPVITDKLETYLHNFLNKLQLDEG